MICTPPPPSAGRRSRRDSENNKGLVPKIREGEVKGRPIMSQPKSKFTSSQQLVPVEVIERLIFLIRGQKVMLDANLAELYSVTV